MFARVAKARLAKLEQSGKPVSDEDREAALTFRWRSDNVPKMLQREYRRRRAFSGQELRRFSGAISWLLKLGDLIDEGGPHGDNSLRVVLGNT